MIKYDPKSLKAEEFINDEEIRETLKYADEHKDDLELVDQIIEKAKQRKGLRAPFFSLPMILALLPGILLHIYIILRNRRDGK